MFPFLTLELPPWNLHQGVLFPISDPTVAASPLDQPLRRVGPTNRLTPFHAPCSPAPSNTSHRVPALIVLVLTVEAQHPLRGWRVH